jgi:hypothetical protein
LTGVLWRRAVFELEVDHGAGFTEVIGGGVVGELRAMVQESFDKIVRAELERTVTKTEVNGVERVNHLLVGISSVEETR